MILILKGKCSSFGGPNDHGVKPDEGLALWEQSDIGFSKTASIFGFGMFKNPHNLFSMYQPQGTSGTARRLDPTQYYIACRWNYDQTPRDFLRKNFVTVTAKKTNKSFHAWPADWGPNDATNRVADLSPGLMKDLGIETDDVVTVEVPTPEKPKIDLSRPYV